MCLDFGARQGGFPQESWRIYEKPTQSDGKRQVQTAFSEFSDTPQGPAPHISAQAPPGRSVSKRACGPPPPRLFHRSPRGRPRGGPACPAEKNSPGELLLPLRGNSPSAPCAVREKGALAPNLHPCGAGWGPKARCGGADIPWQLRKPVCPRLGQAGRALVTLTRSCPPLPPRRMSRRSFRALRRGMTSRRGGYLRPPTQQPAGMYRRAAAL